MHPLERDLRAVADPAKTAFFSKFFKTGKGEYAEGDTFIGVTVPQNRIIAKKHKDIPLTEVKLLLKSPIHECRLSALEIMRMKFVKADENQRVKIVDLYVKHTAYINNWDLVDGSAPYILGAWLDGKDASILDEFAASGNLWKQRIAIVATYHFIRKKEFTHTLRIAKALLSHNHDLIHKAVGWMLREVGNRDRAVEETFLKKHYTKMPRTMLRYAIEKFDKPTYRAYLKRSI